MSKYFGTDGYRGEAGVSLTSLDAYKIGRFIGYYLNKENKRKSRIAIGKDTRRSSYMLEYALASGIASSGADAYILHVTTTPCVSFIVSTEKMDMGAMISASHNPYYDNGIKLVNSRGEKADEKLTELIELYLDNEYEKLGLSEDIPFAKREEVGEIVDYYSGRNRYTGYLISLSQHSFKGLRIGLDLSNGGAFMIAKSVFEALGARTYVIGDSPNGTNINYECGSTHIENLKALVKEKGLDVGFAYDGDADRCIAVDENGNEVNGDHILYILANEMKKRGELSTNTVVTTIMSNLGLYRALRDAGIGYEKTNVGDRFVYENMIKNKHSLGGEQSGHVIISKYATTGDGILTSIKLTEAILNSRATLSRLASPVIMLPQVVKSLRVKSKRECVNNKKILSYIKSMEGVLLDAGRIILRESGTEPVVRIMVEAESRERCEEIIRGVYEIAEAEGLLCKE